MYLFKASGRTYDSVVRHERHAFPGTPKDIADDEFVLLSKNREDCAMLEKQVQPVAKLARIRRADSREIERYWPGSQERHEWRCMAELYWTRRLDHPFNLGDVRGFNAARYRTVQDFAQLDESDERALLRHLLASNESIVLSFVNDARRPGADGR